MEGDRGLIQLETYYKITSIYYKILTVEVRKTKITNNKPWIQLLRKLINANEKSYNLRTMKIRKKICKTFKIHRKLKL